MNIQKTVIFVCASENGKSDFLIKNALSKFIFQKPKLGFHPDFRFWNLFSKKSINILVGRSRSKISRGK